MSLIGIVGLAGSGKDTLCNLILNRVGEMQRYAYADPLKEYAINVLGLTHDECYDPILKEANVEFRVLASDLKECFMIYTDLIIRQHQIESRTYVNVTLEDLWLKFLWVLRNEFSSDDHWWVKLYYSIFRLPAHYVFRTTPRKLLQLLGTEFFRECYHKDFWVGLAPKENIIVPDVRFSNEVAHIKRNGGLVVKIIDPSLKEIQTNAHPSEALARSEIPGAFIVNNDKTLGLKGLYPYVDEIVSRMQRGDNE